MQITAANLFIVDDEEITVCGLVSRYLLNGGYESHAAGSITSAKNKRARQLENNNTLLNSFGFGVAL